MFGHRTSKERGEHVSGDKKTLKFLPVSRLKPSVEANDAGV